MLTKDYQITVRCPHCKQVYTLGVDGVENGCDVCLGIVRNPLDGTVVEMDFSLVFEDDELTDIMEKS